jgi:protein-S-isoprenylcysteine O-methyltransferase Ste14
MKHYAILILGWSFYFVIHSFLAADQTKKFFGTQNSKAYRLLYSLTSIAGLFLLLYINGSYDKNRLFNNEGVVRYFSMMLATFGVIVIRQAFKQYSLTKFTGLNRDEEVFKTEGILKSIRHPLYAGMILIVMGFFFFSPTMSTLISMTCIFLYLPIGIYLEERKLIKKYGDQYLSYREKVPMLVPRLKKNN